jgi:hypothetical protein
MHTATRRGEVGMSCATRKAKVMTRVHSQTDVLGQSTGLPQPRRHRLLQRHPVLFPVLLFTGSLALACASFFSVDLFPLLTLLGISTQPLYFSIAYVLGISGVLAGIIGIIERFDRSKLQMAMFPQPKEQSYVNRN